MNIAEFVEKYNAHAAEIGHMMRIQKTMTDDAHASSLYLSPEVSMVIGERDRVSYVQVICSMSDPGALDGTACYAITLDVIAHPIPDVRNAWLHRLGLFNGKIRQAGAKGTQTTARGWSMACRPHNPSQNLMSYIIREIKITAI